MADPFATDPAVPTGRHHRRDTIISLVTLGAILLFVCTASTVLATVVQRQMMGNATTDRTLTIALILNIALILFGWRRHTDLRRDILVQIAADDRAQLLSGRDSLTGLLTRRALADQGGAMLAQAGRRHRAVALMIIDLKHFRRVNDLHGHRVGDALLRLVGAEIAAALPQSALVARLDGASFAAAFAFDAPHPETVERIADLLGARLAEPLLVNGLHVRLGASIGVARSDNEAPSIDALIRSADIAIAVAKKNETAKFMWFDASMERELNARNETETRLRHAIPEHQIVPYFEQQIDLKTGKLAGFEVLARWDHPTLGVVMPDRFIAIAEESGLIADLSESVMRQAFLAARDWDAALALTINIAPSQMRDPWLAQKILKLLAETGLPAQRLEIDITEAALFDNLPLVQSVTGSLKNQGIRLALDDFGTGYSSIAHLRAIPFDRIKIDRSFVSTINDNVESAAIVTAVARLADSLNLPVTAEGIADEAIEGRVRALGCDRGQGYRFGQPMTAINARRALAELRLIHVVGRKGSAEPGAARQAG